MKNFRLGKCRLLFEVLTHQSKLRLKKYRLIPFGMGVCDNMTWSVYRADFDASFELTSYEIWLISQNPNSILFQFQGVTSVKRINLWALTLVGPTGTRPVLDPLAVLQLDNRLFIYGKKIIFGLVFPDSVCYCCIFCANVVLKCVEKQLNLHSFFATISKVNVEWVVSLKKIAFFCWLHHQVM